MSTDPQHVIDSLELLGEMHHLAPLMWIPDTGDPPTRVHGYGTDRTCRAWAEALPAEPHGTTWVAAIGRWTVSLEAR